MGMAGGFLLVGAALVGLVALAAKAGAISGSSSPAATTPAATTPAVSDVPSSPGPVADTSVPHANWNPLGKPIANWIIPVLQWASQNGWTGTVTSGFRSFAEQAAINASGAFSAVAGESNHETATYPGGAVDVTNASQLIGVLKSYPGAQKLIGGVLGAVDPEHFSATGH